MDDLDNLAKRYYVLEGVDKSDFRRRARILQSIWRTERGYDIGVHSDRLLGSRLVMPWAEETLANYLTDAIREVVRKEVMDRQKSQGKLFARPRIFNDLLSTRLYPFESL